MANQTGRRPVLNVCPHCGQKSVFWNGSVYECLNRACKRTYSKDEFATGGRSGPEPGERWMRGLLFACRQRYARVKRAASSRRLRGLERTLIKTVLSLTAIAVFTFMVWTAFFLFQQKENPLWGLSPVMGVVAILGGIVVLALAGKVLQRYPYRQTAPSFKLVLFLLLATILLCAFGGIDPLASYKDELVADVRSSYAGWQESQKANQEQARLTRAEKIFALVNEARVSNGLSPLVRIDTMDALALEHSQDMAKTGTLSHDGFDARANSIERLLGSSCVGENVAMGYDSAKAFVDGWLDSPGHRANIMNSSYRRTGIGYYKGYATQIFCD